MLKVKIGLRGLKPEEKLNKACRVISGMTQSKIYSQNKKLIEELKSAQSAVAKAIKMAEYGDKRAIAARNLCVKHLDSKLREAASYVEAFSKGDKQEIAMSGFELRERNNRPSALKCPDNFRIKRTEQTGELKLLWSPVRNSKNYLIQTNTEPKNKTSEWRTIHYSTKSRCTIDNLTPGRTYELRVLAIGAGGIGPPSKSEMIMAS